MFVPYLAVLVSSFLAVFASLSRGSYFQSATVKFAFVILHLLCVIGSIVYLCIHFSLWHILFVPCCALAFDWIFALVLHSLFK